MTRWVLWAALGLAGCSGDSDKADASDASPGDDDDTTDDDDDAAGDDDDAAGDDDDDDIGGDDDDDTTGDDDDTGGDDDDAATWGSVDVLFVIDDSSSMLGLQTSLAEAVGTLVDGLQGLDPRFGVISTSSADLVGGDLLDAMGSTTLSERLLLGNGGSDLEQGLGFAAEALQLGDWRGDGLTLVIGLSDEEDCSHGGALDGQAGTECYLQPEALVSVGDLVAAMQAQTTDLRVHAVVATAGSTSTTACEGWPSERWAEAATSTGGLVHPLCSDMATSLQAIVDSL